MRSGKIIASVCFGIVFVGVFADRHKNSGAQRIEKASGPSQSAPVIENMALSETDFKEVLNGLFRDLLAFKNDASFRKYGFSEGGQSSWMREAKALADKKIKSVKGRTAAGHLVQLGLQYYAMKGTESDLTAFYQRSIHEFLGRSAEIDR